MSLNSFHIKNSLKFLKKLGCVYSYTKGDNMIFHYKGAIRPIVIPKYKEVPAFIIKNNMKIIGLSKQRFLEISSDI